MSTPLAFGLSLAGWVRRVHTPHAIVGTFISGLALLLSLFWLVLILTLS